eukprot:CAMPEP_0182465180 /NCGR_PEP_ID=MMETSP1319-20130603/9042_1 /TAXON_ID=172717 /ORGANISM="Bolidomonas pacifica, Strain RCC208" /LENGTH=205 /DNA_ID=CAMNT_0024664871 /DNA_START=40 /DNA_END=657 /DNA_ORIENTATION=-
MGINRDAMHKRRASGGKRPKFNKKRKHTLGRQPAMTKLAAPAIHRVRTRGGNSKFRAMSLHSGTYTFGSFNLSKKVRIVDVVYNASSNELLRTKTLVRGAIVEVDSTPFKAALEARFDTKLGLKKARKGRREDEEETPARSSRVQRKLAARKATFSIDQSIDDQLASGRILCKITSRPGQSGRADGYILEGDELSFYVRQMRKRK